MWKLRQGHFAALIIGRRISTRLWFIQAVAIYAGGIEMLEGTGARPGEMGWVGAHPNTVREHFDGKTDSNGPGACFLTPWTGKCGKWLEKHLGGVWVEGSLCVASGDMEDILCGLDMEGFVEKVDYSLCPEPNPFHGSIRKTSFPDRH